jgi:hypothetical protein
MKLIVSPHRYSALLHASHILDRNSVVVILYNGDEERTKYPDLCREALRVQRKFEIEKAYKIYNVRHIHTMNMLHNRLDYELIATMLQMMIAAQGFTHLYYYLSKDPALCEIFRALIRTKKIAYSPDQMGCDTACSDINIIFLEDVQGLDTLSASRHILHDAAYDKKVGACKKMVTIDNYLLSYGGFRIEYTCPHKEE